MTTKSREESVKVMARVRPMNSREISSNCVKCVHILSEQSLSIGEGTEERQFTFDFVFDESHSQQFIYETSSYDIVESVFQGYNGTIFAYGQTGCGKTHTMLGDPASETGRGVLPRCFFHCRAIQLGETGRQFLLRVSFLEIYNEQVFDLLTPGRERREVKEAPGTGVFVKDLAMLPASSLEEMLRLLDRGTKARAVAETAMNKESSRSHCIFTVHVEAADTPAGQPRFTASKLNLVDLAGSERSDRTHAQGDRLKEGAKINLSLTALGNVIKALVDGKAKHVPYRDSKLTRILQDSLGGNTRTLMLAAISPASDSFEETLSTLKFT